MLAAAVLLLNSFMSAKLTVCCCWSVCCGVSDHHHYPGSFGSHSGQLMSLQENMGRTDTLLLFLDLPFGLLTDVRKRTP